MPPTGFQAIILCGPGVSFDTFTSKAEVSPKALIPIANRPMVWYPLDFCYRMGITSKCFKRSDVCFAFVRMKGFSGILILVVTLIIGQNPSYF